MSFPPLPPREFPFWCRALYSWSGERKRDLGFVEGDLIECLNAGDGSWWMGRLRRDKRIIGFFPSNFVKIIDSPSNISSASAPNFEQCDRCSRIGKLIPHVCCNNVLSNQLGECASAGLGDSTLSAPYLESPNPIQNSPNHGSHVLPLLSSFIEKESPSVSIFSGTEIAAGNLDYNCNEISTLKPDVNSQICKEMQFPQTSFQFEHSYSLEGNDDANMAIVPASQPSFISRESFVNQMDKVTGTKEEFRYQSMSDMCDDCVLNVGKPYDDFKYEAAGIGLHHVQTSNIAKLCYCDKFKIENLSNDSQHSFSLETGTRCDIGVSSQNVSTIHSRNSSVNVSPLSRIALACFSRGKLLKKYTFKPNHASFVKYNHSKAGAECSSEARHDYVCSQSVQSCGTNIHFWRTRLEKLSIYNRYSNKDETQSLCVRRDINRCNTISAHEIIDRSERCGLLNFVSVRPIDVFEIFLGLPNPHILPSVFEHSGYCHNIMHEPIKRKIVPTDQSLPYNIQFLVDSICAQRTSVIDKLKVIFQWIVENIMWDYDYSSDYLLSCCGEDACCCQVLKGHRGNSKEIAMLMHKMCAAVEVPSEIIQGYFKNPEDDLQIAVSDTSGVLTLSANHWWVGLIHNEEWLMVDCAVASQLKTRELPSSCVDCDTWWWFLTPPEHFCFTHVSLVPEQQHLVPVVPPSILLALPCAYSPYFICNIALVNFDTSVLYMENLEITQISIQAPENVICSAEVEYLDSSGNDNISQQNSFLSELSLCQPKWVKGIKHYYVKALLPMNHHTGTLKIYVDTGECVNIPRKKHMAVSFPLRHYGYNVPFSFVKTYTSKYSILQYLYVVQPQCLRLVVRETYNFVVRQHYPLKECSKKLEHCNVKTRQRSNHSAFASASGGAQLDSYCMKNSFNDAVFEKKNHVVKHLAMFDKRIFKDCCKLALQSPSKKLVFMKLIDIEFDDYSTSIQHRQLQTAESHEMLTENTKYNRIFNFAPYETKSFSNKFLVREQCPSVELIWKASLKISDSGTWRGLVRINKHSQWLVFAEWVVH